MFPQCVVKYGQQRDMISEADKLTRIRHLGIVRVFAVVGPHDRQPGPQDSVCMVMERLGSSIAPHLSGRSGLPWNQSVANNTHKLPKHLPLLDWLCMSELAL